MTVLQVDSFASYNHENTTDYFTKARNCVIYENPNFSAIDFNNNLWIG